MQANIFFTGHFTGNVYHSCEKYMEYFNRIVLSLACVIPMGSKMFWKFCFLFFLCDIS